MKTFYRTQTVDNVEVFYREAGRADAPVLLLLHGFPTAGHMFRELIPLLARDYRVIAPDLPGFGQTRAPARRTFDYTFDNLAHVIDGFTEALKLLLHDPALRAAMGRNGKAYVNRNYRWSAILTKYERLIARLRTQPAREPERAPERERPRETAREPRRENGRDRGRPHGRDRHRPGDRDRGGRGQRPRR